MGSVSEQPPKGVIARVLARSMFLQASLNSVGMQNLGRLFCLVPVARWLGAGREHWRSFAVRHLGVFNGNPFIATLGLGALARIESDAAAEGTEPPREMVDRFSARLSAPLGSVGDELFWTSIRPQTALFGVLVAVLAGPWIGGLAYLVAFGAWQTWSRVKGFEWGWELGTKVGQALRDERLRRPARVAAASAAAFAGAAMVFAAANLLPEVSRQGETAVAYGVFVLAAGLGTIWTIRPRSASVVAIGGGILGAAGSLLANLVK